MAGLCNRGRDYRRGRSREREGFATTGYSRENAKYSATGASTIQQPATRASGSQWASATDRREIGPAERSAVKAGRHRHQQAHERGNGQRLRKEDRAGRPCASLCRAPASAPATRRSPRWALRAARSRSGIFLAASRHQRRRLAAPRTLFRSHPQSPVMIAVLCASFRRALKSKGLMLPVFSPSTPAISRCDDPRPYAIQTSSRSRCVSCAMARCSRCVAGSAGRGRLVPQCPRRSPRSVDVMPALRCRNRSRTRLVAMRNR